MIPADVWREVEQTIPVELRPRLRIRANGCIELRGAVNGKCRYAATSNGRLAHRVVWSAMFGPSPWLVIRTCGNPLCIRVPHLREMDWRERFATRHTKKSAA